MESDQNNPANDAISPETLKKAYKAFKKRLKVQRLDDNSSLGRGPFSGGEKGLTAISPPNQYPREVWDELCKQGKMRSAGQGLYEINSQ